MNNPPQLRKFNVLITHFLNVRREPVSAYTAFAGCFGGIEPFKARNVYMPVLAMRMESVLADTKAHMPMPFGAN